MNNEYSPYFINLSQVFNPKIRIFCFPYAGGSSSTFVPFARKITEHVEFLVIQPPGKGSRFREKPYDNMQNLVDNLYTNIKPLLNMPYIFLGHSLGSRVAFELLRKIDAAALPLPIEFIASGSRGPQVSAIRKPISGLDDKQFAIALQEFGRVNQQVLDNDELLSLILPAIKADFKISEEYYYSGTASFACPLTVFGGTDDPLVAEHELDSWFDLFEQDKNIILFKGRHFFIDDNHDLVVDALSKIIQAKISRCLYKTLPAN
ncbi:thioesterase II family protein [Xenorhabdus innexi]|uniref:Putative Gramicidin S biosynthesis protein grsT n=1 Tax=Xenorhabdus innexi TaxID=290109 RepID=A0A1N6MQ07_9GAMM|nr:thioesterase domain-containing protein [Xenorhabdus innexi]PHM36429.1 putative thioesterase [Xenorhabdus innexi]SIP70942.1 putative Gramicidin S biosynthesis protein grsT [Xenorhabdus innexi]